MGRMPRWEGVGGSVDLGGEESRGGGSPADRQFTHLLVDW